MRAATLHQQKPKYGLKINKAANESTHLSLAQKTFNQLIKKIEQRRSLLLKWQETIPCYERKCIAELAPLQKTFADKRIVFVKLLDKAYQEHSFTKLQRRKITEVILTLLDQLIFQNEQEDLKKIYDRYAEMTYDDEVEMDKDMLRESAKTIFGVELDDDVNLSSIDEIMANLGKKFVEQESSKETEKKPKKLSKSEVKKQKSIAEIKQSVREIYRKLAAALHPDRVVNDDEKQRRHELMQRVNSAYKKQDLLSLLQLQLEIEQIDQASIDSISAERLKHYNNVLKDQVHEIDGEIFTLSQVFLLRHHINPPTNEPAKILNSLFPSLEHRIREMRQCIDMLEDDLLIFQNVKQLKAWVNNYPLQEQEFDFF